MEYCQNCGSKITENSSFCASCGANLTVGKDLNANKRTNGLSIASLILGIIAITWSILMFISLDSSIYELKMRVFKDASFIVGYMVGYTGIAILSSIIALVLGVFGNKKKINGIGITGIILSILGILASTIVIIYTLSST